MKLTFAVAISAALAFASEAYAYPNANSRLTINTPVPGVTACQPFLVVWSGGIAPYFLDVLKASDPIGSKPQPLVVNTQAKQFTWTPAYKPGTKLTLELRDSTGVTVFTPAFTVLKGQSTGCINA